MTTIASAHHDSIDPLGLDLPSLVAEFGECYGKGEYHALAMFRSIHRTGAFDPRCLPEYAGNP